MKPEVKQVWISALRSGRYTQGQGQLQNIKGNNCCLAVLGLEQGLKIDEDNGSFDGDYDHPNVGDATYPCLVQFGLDEELQRRFISMNDNEGKTFEEIATYIEKEIFPN